MSMALLLYHFMPLISTREIQRIFLLDSYRFWQKKFVPWLLVENIYMKRQHVDTPYKSMLRLYGSTVQSHKDSTRCQTGSVHTLSPKMHCYKRQITLYLFVYTTFTLMAVLRSDTSNKGIFKHVRSMNQIHWKVYTTKWFLKVQHMTWWLLWW